jgi:hypothetical protein
MSFELLLSVLGLAVLDMLSPTTIAVTITVLLTADRRAGPLLALYWTTIAVAYFLLGVVLMLGLGSVFAVLDETVGLWVQAAVGAAMIVGSFFITNRRPEVVAKRATPRALTPAAMILFGFGTWTFEALTAVPYLGAIALMTGADLPPLEWVPILAGYVVVMFAPCVVLWAAWAVTGDRLRARLERWRTRLASGSRTAISWIVGIAGFLVARDAVWRLIVSAGWIEIPTP